MNLVISFKYWYIYKKCRFGMLYYDKGNNVWYNKRDLNHWEEEKKQTNQKTKTRSNRGSEPVSPCKKRLKSICLVHWKKNPCGEVLEKSGTRSDLIRHTINNRIFEGNDSRTSKVTERDVTLETKDLGYVKSKNKKVGNLSFGDKIIERFIYFTSLLWKKTET